MKYQFAFGDEAGSPGGKPGETSTTHFVTALLLTNDPEGLRTSIRQFRQEKRIRVDSELSFNSSPDANRLACLNELLKSDFAVRAVVFDKRTLNKGPRDLYTESWTKLFKWLAFKELGRAHVTMDEYGSPSTTIPTLMKSLRAEAGIHVPGPSLAAPIRAVRSNSEFGIEAADMVAGAIFRMVEHGDTRFYAAIRSRAQIWRPVENENPPS